MVDNTQEVNDKQIPREPDAFDEELSKDLVALAEPESLQNLHHKKRIKSAHHGRRNKDNKLVNLRNQGV